MSLSDVFSGILSGGSSGESAEKPEIDIKIEGRKGSKNKADKKRLVGFVNTIARHSPFGRAVLEDAAGDGYTLVMEDQKDSYGFCDKPTKIIALNPNASDDMLIATLAHESRHAQQFSRGATDDYKAFDMKSGVMLSRAMEADAEAASAATCHEIRINSGNDGPWREVVEATRTIAMGFAAATPSMNAPVSDAMLQGAFNGWYKDAWMVEAYERAYFIDEMRQSMKEEKPLPAYDKKLSSEEIVAMFCSGVDGKCYWADQPKVLEAPEKLEIAVATRNVAKKFFDVRQMRDGKAPDPSLDELDIRGDLFSKKRKAQDGRATGSAARLIASAKDNQR